MLARSVPLSIRLFHIQMETSVPAGSVDQDGRARGELLHCSCVEIRCTLSFIVAQKTLQRTPADNHQLPVTGRHIEAELQALVDELYA